MLLQPRPPLHRALRSRSYAGPRRGTQLFLALRHRKQWRPERTTMAVHMRRTTWRPRGTPPGAFHDALEKRVLPRARRPTLGESGAGCAPKALRRPRANPLLPCLPCAGSSRRSCCGQGSDAVPAQGRRYHDLPRVESTRGGSPRLRRWWSKARSDSSPHCRRPCGCRGPDTPAAGSSPW